MNNNMRDRIEKINTVELWYEPSSGLKSEITIQSEMVDDDHAFLCGMIKEIRPKKIVEIGVAEGGTTAVIMNCLKLLDMNSKVYSVDLNERLYYDKNRETGYVSKQLLNHISGKNIHEFKLGKTIAGCIDEIGDGIDFVIIDTTHVLPGELLDFLCVLPYLTENAVIVLHDISLNYISSFSDDIKTLFSAKDYNATKILYTTVTAKKWFYFEDEPGFNIAAFTINADTIKYITDCFQALSLTWEYLMSEKMLSEYRNILSRYYNEQCLKLFDMAVKVNNNMVNTFRVAKKSMLFDQLPKSATLTQEKIDRLRNAQKVIIYGAGIVAVEIVKILQEEEIEIYAIAVSNPENNIKRLCGIQVKKISDLLDIDDAEIVIASILEKYIQEMEAMLQEMGFTHVMKADKISNSFNSYISPQFYDKK